MEKRRDGSIIEAGVQAVSVTRPSVSYKQNNDGTEEARIGPDMDMHRLIALYIVAPGQGERNRDRGVRDRARGVNVGRARPLRGPGRRRRRQVFSGGRAPVSRSPSELRKRIEAAARIEREIDKTNTRLSLLNVLLIQYRMSALIFLCA